MLNETIKAQLGILRRVWRHFGPHLQHEWLLIGWGFVTLLAEIAWRVAEPWSLKFVIDYVIGHHDRSQLPLGQWLNTIDTGILLPISIAGMVALTALRASAEYANTISFALAGSHVLTAVRKQLYEHLQRLSLSFHNKARNGDLIVRLSNDINQLTDVSVTAALPLLGNILVMIGMLATMVWMNPMLAGMAVLTLPLFWIISTRYSGRIQDAARKQRKREGALAATAAESFGAIKIVQALSLESIFAAAFSAQSDHSLSEGVRATRLSKSLERSVDVMLVCANGLILWYGAQLVMNQQLTIGDLLVFLSYLKSSLKPIQDFAKYTGRLAKASASGERIVDLLETHPDVHDLPGAEPAPRLRGQIAFKQVSFGYEANQSILHNLNFALLPGQRLAIVGPSGNGKSTLINLLLRLYDPTSGAVQMDGRDIRDYTIESLRAQMSVVMQDTILFAGSVRENIALGMPEATHEQIERAAKLANADEFITRFADGYDTVIGERGTTLSNGQRQRISIARAAIRNSPILVLDEATTGLDKASERLVMEALERLAHGRTTIYITHDLTQIKSNDHVMVIEAGHMREFGLSADLLRAQGIYARMRQIGHAITPAPTAIASAII